MKKAQLFGQPIVYIFFALVAAMVLFFGIKVIFDLQDTGSRIEFETFASDVESKIETVYSDSSGSVISLDDLLVPKQVVEVCFVGYDELDKVTNSKLRDLIAIDDENNVYFGGVDLEYNPRRKIDLLRIEGTICDKTDDRSIDLLLYNIGTQVEVRVPS